MKKMSGIIGAMFDAESTAETTAGVDLVALDEELDKLTGDYTRGVEAIVAEQTNGMEEEDVPGLVGTQGLEAPGLVQHQEQEFLRAVAESTHGVVETPSTEFAYPDRGNYNSATAGLGYTPRQSFQYSNPVPTAGMGYTRPNIQQQPTAGLVRPGRPAAPSTAGFVYTRPGAPTAGLAGGFRRTAPPSGKLNFDSPIAVSAPGPTNGLCKCNTCRTKKNRHGVVQYGEPQ